jgi:hypothetical protein
VTALQWMAGFQHVHVHHVGRAGDLFWALVTADADGTELQDYFVMERASGEVRVIQNLPGDECVRAMKDPAAFWEHRRAQSTLRDSQPRLV